MISFYIKIKYRIFFKSKITFAVSDNLLFLSVFTD